MRSHRGLEVALLTKRKPPEPRQVFGCDKDQSDPWPLQLHMYGPVAVPIDPNDPRHVGESYRTEWQVHTEPVAYPEYVYMERGPFQSVFPGDPRVLQPQGVGNCKTYSLVCANNQFEWGRLYFKSRMFASPPGSLGAWDFTWSTTLRGAAPGDVPTTEYPASNGSTIGHLLNVYVEVPPLYKVGTYVVMYYGTHPTTGQPCFNIYSEQLYVPRVYLCSVPLFQADTHTIRLDFRLLLAKDWCKLAINGQVFTIDYVHAFSAFDLVTVDLWMTRAGHPTVQISDIAVTNGPENKFAPYPFE